MMLEKWRNKAKSIQPLRLLLEGVTIDAFDVLYAKRTQFPGRDEMGRTETGQRPAAVTQNEQDED